MDVRDRFPFTDTDHWCQTTAQELQKQFSSWRHLSTHKIDAWHAYYVLVFKHLKSLRCKATPLSLAHNAGYKE